MCVRVAQLEEAWTVGRSSSGCVKLTKSLQQAFNPKISVSIGSISKLGGLVYHNNFVGTFKIHLCPLHNGQVLRLPGAVSSEVLHNASFWMTLTVPKVAGTEVPANLPFLLDPSSIYLSINTNIRINNQ